MVDNQEQINFKQKKTNYLEINYEVDRTIKVMEIKKEVDFEGLKFEVLEMEKNMMTNKEPNCVFVFQHVPLPPPSGGRGLHAKNSCKQLP